MPAAGDAKTIAVDLRVILTVMNVFKEKGVTQVFAVLRVLPTNSVPMMKSAMADCALLDVDLTLIALMT